MAPTLFTNILPLPPFWLVSISYFFFFLRATYMIQSVFDITEKLGNKDTMEYNFNTVKEGKNQHLWR